MAQTRSPSKIPIIRGSTRDILVGLYANLMKISGLPTNKNLILENAIKRVDAPVASMREALFETPNHLQETVDGASASITRLESHKETKDLVAQNQYPDTLALLKQKAVTLNQKEIELKAEYLKLVDGQTKIIRELLLSYAEGKKPDPQVLINLEIKQVGFARTVKEYLEEQRKTQRELDRLHIEVYSRAKDKTALPAPKEKAITRIRITPQGS